MIDIIPIEEVKKEKNKISRFRNYTISGTEYINIFDSMITIFNENIELNKELIELKKELKETKAIKQEVIIKEKIIYRKR